MQKSPTKIKDDWIETYTGRKIWLQNPDPKDICLTDISHALSQICRFNGHTLNFYSVAQHCVLVSELLEARGYDKRIQMWGLFHDAGETYLGDITKPLKPMLEEFDDLEENFLDKIAEVFGLGERTTEIWDAVKWADVTLVHAEGVVLMKRHEWVDLDMVEDYHNYVPGDLKAITSPASAKRAFTDRYLDLKDKL